MLAGRLLIELPGLVVLLMNLAFYDACLHTEYRADISQKEGPLGRWEYNFRWTSDSPPIETARWSWVSSGSAYEYFYYEGRSQLMVWEEGSPLQVLEDICGVGVNCFDVRQLDCVFVKYGRYHILEGQNYIATNFHAQNLPVVGLEFVDLNPHQVGAVTSGTAVIDLNLIRLRELRCQGYTYYFDD